MLLIASCDKPQSENKATSSSSVDTEPAESGKIPVTGKAAAGTGVLPLLQVKAYSGAGLEVTFTAPTDWGTRDDGTLVNKKDVTLWLFYLQDDDGDKTKEDIIREVGTAAVKIGIFSPDRSESLTGTTKGVIQLRGDGPYKVNTNYINKQYALFVRIIHPDSTVANKKAPKANEGTKYKRDTAVVKATSGGP